MSINHEKSKATRILATNCCICSRKLVDAKSVEFGIGPVCRRKYGKVDIETTPEMHKKALGALAVSGLAPHVIDAVLKHGKDARQVCNWLVYWASANYTDKRIVLACTPIIRLLGYTTLADKLEKDRATVRLTVVDDGFEVYTPRDNQTIRGLRQIGGTIVHRANSDRFKCWKVPTRSKQSLSTLLGVSFGNEYCHVAYTDGTTKTFTIEPATWTNFTATLPKKSNPTNSHVHYRKTSNGEWVVIGPSHLIHPGTVTVTLKNGNKKTEVVERRGMPFLINGTPHVYGYLAKRMANAGTATTPAYRGSYRY